MRHPVYSFGYQGQALERFVARARALKNYKAGPIDILDLLRGLDRMLSHLATRPVVPICICAKEADCHWAIALNAFRARGS